MNAIATSFEDSEGTNQYPIWIGLFMALIMVSVSTYPAWWMFLALGLGANGIVCAANGWKMPVRGLQNWKMIRHTPMLSSTRYKWLGDIIPVFFGKASIGDFLLFAGMLGGYASRDRFADGKLIAVVCLVIWASGWSGGFRLFKKWTTEARRDAKKNIPIVLMLILVGNLLNIRGCGIGELRASANSVKEAVTASRKPEPKKVEPKKKWHDLGTVQISSQFMRRLKQLDADSDRERQQEKEAIASLVAKDQLPASLTAVKIGGRKGPFCRMTCTFHHGEMQQGMADVEVDADTCKAKSIPPTIAHVWGWQTDVAGQYEYKSPWPGPAGGGLDSYKIYWADAKVKR